MKAHLILIQDKDKNGEHLIYLSTGSIYAPSSELDSVIYPISEDGFKRIYELLGINKRYASDYRIRVNTDQVSEVIHIIRESYNR